MSSFGVKRALPNSSDLLTEKSNWLMRGVYSVSGATSGPNPPADLNRVFFLQLQVLGSTMGTRTEFEDLLSFMERTGVRPHVQFTYALDDVAAAIDLMATGGVQGKLVVIP